MTQMRNCGIEREKVYDSDWETKIFSPRVELLPVWEHAVIMIPNIISTLNCAQALLWRKSFFNYNVIGWYWWGITRNKSYEKRQ